jgi:hypothetical protein
MLVLEPVSIDDARPGAELEVDAEEEGWEDEYERAKEGWVGERAVMRGWTGIMLDAQKGIGDVRAFTLRGEPGTRLVRRERAGY